MSKEEYKPSIISPYKYGTTHTVLDWINELFRLNAIKYNKLISEERIRLILFNAINMNLTDGVFHKPICQIYITYSDFKKSAESLGYKVLSEDEYIETDQKVDDRLYTIALVEIAHEK